MIILVGGEKGGVGKTTLTVNLATKRRLSGHDILIVDADKQASANLWAGIRETEDIQPPVRCVQKKGKSLGADVKDLSTRFEDVIIDAGGQDSVELRAALTIANLAVFPIQPSLFDAATLETIASLVAQAQAFNPDLVAGIVINRASTNPRVKEVMEVQDLIGEYDDLHLMQSIIRDRIAFRHCARNGLGIWELAERDKTAEHELEALYSEVYGSE